MRAPGFAFALASTLLCAPVRAEPPRQPGAGELRAALERLLVVGNVLYVAAHPDDENTRLLAYLVGAEKVRAAYLSLTRGDGGQNLVGAEQGPLLGLLRTQELLAARRVDGAEQLFTRAIDFGYSKRAEETLAIWSRDEVLADVVWAIRRFRPDVVITRFPPDGGDTHGHHTASAILAVQAFALAGDPQYRPDQVARVGAWKPRRIVWNRGRWNPDPKEDMSGFLSVDIGGYDPLLGASWGEIAADSRSMHKSQGFGAARTRGPQLEYFKSLGGDPIQKSLFDGVDRTWTRVAGSGELRRLLAEARSRFDGAHPEASVPVLVKASGILAAMQDFPWKAAKTRELAEVIAACAGLWIGLESMEPTAVAGKPMRLSLEVLERAPAGLVLERVQLEGGPTLLPAYALEPGRPFRHALELPLSPEHRGTSPYWLDEPPAQGLYTVRDPTRIGDPEGPPAATAELTFRLGTQTFSLRRAAAYRWVDPVLGERYRPLEILPPVVVSPARPVLLAPSGAPADLRVRVQASDKAQAGVVRPAAPAGWTVEPKERTFSLAAAGAEAEVAFRVTPPASPPAAEATLRLVAHVLVVHVLPVDRQGLAPLVLQLLEAAAHHVGRLGPLGEVVRLALLLEPRHGRRGAGDVALGQIGADLVLVGFLQVEAVGLEAAELADRLQAAGDVVLHPLAADHVDGRHLLEQFAGANVLRHPAEVLDRPVVIAALHGAGAAGVVEGGLVPVHHDLGDLLGLLLLLDAVAGEEVVFDGLVVQGGDLALLVGRAVLELDDVLGRRGGGRREEDREGQVVSHKQQL